MGFLCWLRNVFHAYFFRVPENCSSYRCLNTSFCSFCSLPFLSFISFLFFSLLFHVSLKLQWEHTSLQPANAEGSLLKPYLLIYLLTVPLFLSLSFLIPSSPISLFPYSPFCFELFKYKETKLFIIISHLLMLMPEQFWKLKQRVWFPGNARTDKNICKLNAM